MNTYFINKRTMAILSDGMETTIVETDGYFHTDESPLKIVDISLRNFGSNLKAACASTRMMIGDIRRTPIMISWENEVFLFPCKSIRRLDNIWLSLSHLMHIKRAGEEQCLVYFSNKVSILIDVPYKVVHRGFLRALHLKNMYEKQFSNEANDSKRNHFSFIPNQEVLFVREKPFHSYICKTDLQ